MTRFAKLAATALMPLALFAQQTIVLRDGTQFTGTMTSATPNSVMFRDNGGINHRFEVNQIDSLRFNERGSDNRGNNFGFNGNNQGSNNGPQSGYNNNGGQNAYNNDRGQAGNSDFAGRGYARREGNRMTLSSGTEISVRTNERIESSDANNSNRFYSAVVNRDVMDDRGNVVIPRGSDAQLIVRRLANNTVALDLQSISVNGQQYNVDSAEVSSQGTSREGLGENRRTAEYTGGGALLGTLLGAIAGGGKGAAIGALAGGAAGAGVQVMTRGGQVRVPAETELTFRLDTPMTLRY